MPTLLLTNANRIRNKLDELYVMVQEMNPNIIAITETWLDDTIPDTVCSLPNYSIVRRDRQGKLGGGVMLYLSNENYFRLLNSLLPANDFELLWVMVRPRLLPRAVSVLIIGVVYFPPWYSVSLNKELCHFIMQCVDILSRHYLNAGFLIVGDFNQANTSVFNRHLSSFRQIVLNPTRANNILDKIFTNCYSFYSSPVIMPPLGRSDHNCVFLSSKNVLHSSCGFKEIQVKRFDVFNIGAELSRVKWQDLFLMSNCQDQADFFILLLILFSVVLLRLERLKSNVMISLGLIIIFVS